MGLFFVYILKASVCLVGFYLFYRLLLSQETFHRFNRIALLGVLVLSGLVPFAEGTMQWFSGFNQPLLEFEEMMLMTDFEPEVVVEEAVEAPFPWRALLLVVYLAGVVFFLLCHLWSLGRMARLVKRCRKERLDNGIALFVHDNNKVAPFSWMKIIVIAEEDLKENKDAILKHECAHIKYGHSWDLLLAELCVILQWFNPAAWLMKQELQNIHEYEADEWVIQNGIDAKRYQLLIIKKAVGARLYSIANSFNHSSLKKRITMMIKKKSNPWARMKYLYVLPLAAIAIAAFARPEVSNELNEISSVKVNDLASIMKTDEVKSVENSSEEKFKLSGQVMSVAGKKPVVGASVLVRGTTYGTLSDANGKFELQVKKGDVLVVSYIGLQTQSLPVETQANLVVWMKDDVQSMEEMVVVGMAPKEEAASAPQIVPNAKPVVQDGEIFTVVEEMPQFPGGMGEAMKFLAKNIKYPAVALQNKIEGRVIVQFVVKENGKVADLKVVRGVTPELDAEALRVVGLMPDWIPGKQRGKAVAVKYTMPIMFRLSSPAPKEEAASAPQIVPNAKPVVQDGEIFTVVEEMPQFPGGMGEAMKFLAKNIKYPAVALQNKIEGRVIVQFVVKENGKVADLKVVRGVTPELDAEALRVVGLMPDWIPGKQRGKAVAVKYTMPIMFRLDSPAPKEEAASAPSMMHLNVEKGASQANVENVKNQVRSQVNGMAVRGAEGKSPLVVVDGKEVGYGASLISEIPIGDIQLISVLNEKNSIAKYGEKAKDGAIEIKTKKK